MSIILAQKFYKPSRKDLKEIYQQFQKEILRLQVRSIIQVIKCSERTNIVPTGKKDLLFKPNINY